jgi:hypothetical protein
MRLFNTFCFLLIGITSTFANNILVENVTTIGNNATNKTIQVQFDLSWDNSWRDTINWDAAWIFLKFKDADGNWQHAQLNTTGFANGSGISNTMQVTSDKIGCWAHRSTQGSGTFTSASMQLQWNYGLSGLNDITGLEVRVFAVEMGILIVRGHLLLGVIVSITALLMGILSAAMVNFLRPDKIFQLLTLS